MLGGGGLKLGGLTQLQPTTGLAGTTGGLNQSTNQGLKLNLGGLGGTGGLGNTGGGLGITGGGLGTTSGGLGVTGGGLGGTSVGGLKLGGGTGGLQLGQQNTGGGLGGLGLPKSGIFNQQQQGSQMQQQQQLAQKALQSQLTLNAIKPPGPSVFGDERDLVLMQFNWLQACSGTGKGLVNHAGNTQMVDFTPESLVCRFKTICYNRLPTTKNEDGLVAFQFKKKFDLLISQQEAVIKSLQELVSKAVTNATTEVLKVFCDSIRPLPDNCSEMTIYILKKSGMLSQRQLATNMHQFFQNPSRKAQLESLGVSSVYAKTGFTLENLKLYLQTPPSGISTQLWEQSKKDNPNPQKYIPVPVVGSAALLGRMKHQDQESRQQQSRLEILTDEVAQLKRSHTTAMARMAEYRRKLGDLSHRVLRLMVAQEVLRKSGYSVQPEEEQLRVRLENIQVELDAPLQFKGRLTELMAQLRMQTQVPGTKMDSRYPVDTNLLNNIKQHLTQQQGALLELVKIIKEDNEDIQCIKEGFERS